MEEKRLIKKIMDLPEKTLESSGLDLCGYSQDDVWEKAIQYFKEQIRRIER